MLICCKPHYVVLGSTFNACPGYEVISIFSKAKDFQKAYSKLQRDFYLVAKAAQGCLMPSMCCAPLPSPPVTPQLFVGPHNKPRQELGQVRALCWLCL